MRSDEDAPSATDRHSGVGGYPLLVDLLLPIANDPNSRDGRERIGLGDAGQDRSPSSRSASGPETMRAV